MEMVDQDNNGFIEYEEFLRVSLNKKKLISEDHLKMAFDKFDLNNDGKLSKNELLLVFGQSDLEYVNNLMIMIDKNGDGEISYPEFCDMMKKIVYNSNGETIIFDSSRKLSPKSEHCEKRKKKQQSDQVLNLVKIKTEKSLAESKREITSKHNDM